LARTGGEAGESLLAGTGLLNLRTVLDKLDTEARSLFGDGRGRRRLSEAVEAWRQAHRDMEERAVAPRAWQEADAAYADAAKDLTDVQTQIRDLAAEDSRLQRVRRVAPLLAELVAAREALERVADTPRFPADAESRFNRSVIARREATRDAERENAETQRLVQERAALAHDTLALAVQDAIDALGQRQPVVIQATHDLPSVRASMERHRAKVAQAIDSLGLSSAPEEARDTLPTAATRRNAERLIKQHGELRTAATLASQNLADARRIRDQAEEALRNTPAPPSPVLLRETIEAVRGEGHLDADVARAERKLAAARDATAAALARLPLWRADIAALSTAPLPLPAAADLVARQLDASSLEVVEARRNAAALEAEIAQLEEEVLRLSRGELVPTPAAVATARFERDRVWRLIRRAHEGGPSPSAEDRTGLALRTLPDTFEALRDEADRLADRRAEDAQRVADFLTATARLELLRGRHETARGALVSCEDAAGRAEAAWRSLWAPADLVPATPTAMTEWRRNRDEVLRLAQVEADARFDHDTAAERRERARLRLTALLPAITPPETVASLLLHAETTCRAAEAEDTAHRDRVKALHNEEQRLPEKLQAVNEANAALAAWLNDWAPSVAALGLDANASIPTAEAALAAWGTIAETVPAWRIDELRITDMEASIRTFTAQVCSVLTQISEPMTDEPPTQIAARLTRRLTEARKATSDADGLTKRIEAHEAGAADATARLRAAEAELEDLRGIAGAADDAELEQSIARAKERDSAVRDIARLGQSLRTQGDGMAEEALRTEAVGVHPDAAGARLAEIRSELDSLGERREVLSVHRTRAEAMLADMRRGHDATAKAQEAEDALAEARASAERYARLHVARVLLRSGIERFRKEQQGPLLRNAGMHFSRLTGGRYERLVVDQNATGQTVVFAIRDEGTECPMEALSEGTRDQLYLALRIAAVEHHAQQAEPLPFIADDLLVQFDDVRAAAAIALLAELGRTTQVILFTHHDHIAALASRQAGAAVQTMPAVQAPVIGSFAAA